MTDRLYLKFDYPLLEEKINSLARELHKIREESFRSFELNTVWDLFENLSPEDFLSLRDNLKFSSFLKQMSLSTSEINTDHQIDKYNVSVLPSKDLHLTEVIQRSLLPPRFLKFFKRLRSIHVNRRDEKYFEKFNTVNDVLLLNESEIYQLPNMGKLYASTLTDLKKIYDICGSEEVLNESTDFFNLESFEMGDMIFNYSRFSDDQIKCLNKLERSGISLDLKSFIFLDVSELKKTCGFGKKLSDDLKSIIEILKSEVERIYLGEIDYMSWESKIISPADPKNISIEKFSSLILEDFDNYFDRISEDELNILQRRWGFVETKGTLEEVGIEHNLTRERIRQIEIRLTNGLLKSLRFSQVFIWSLLEKNLSKNIPNQMKDLRSCFESNSDFYDVLGIISGQSGLEQLADPDISLSFLNDFFIENGAPVSCADISEYILECNTEGIRDTDGVISFLQENNCIRIDGDNVWPLNLKKKDAAACLLASHPNGLPWIDISYQINYNRYSRSKLPTDRLDASLIDSNIIYLSGRGVYRHIRFIDFSLIDKDAIFDELTSFSEKNNRQFFHLNECFQKSDVLKKNDYYVIRHVVKIFGEEYGFFFDGRSSTDSVGLERNFKRITQKDVILEAMKSHSKPLTRNEIAGLLKSKSVEHASLYIDEMLKAGKIVQLERMLYTIPEKAYKDIDVLAYLSAIENILVSEARPVEQSFLKDIINFNFLVSYSKYFYSSLARLHFEKRGWYRKKNLYSLTPILYESLSDMVRKYCDVTKSLEQNITQLRTKVSITHETASIAIYNSLRETQGL